MGVLRWWGRRRGLRSRERELNDDFARVRRQMAEDAKRLIGRWRELDRLEAELERKRAELARLDEQIGRVAQGRVEDKRITRSADR